jgi:methanol metabolism-related c-type cytochrome
VQIRRLAESHLALTLILVYTLTPAIDLAHADGSGNPAATTSTDGEYKDQAGNPTYKIGPEGTVDWYTDIGYVRYGANCLACHGPDGLGSSYAPSLITSLKSLTYSDFIATVIAGKKNVSASQDLVMPPFGTNKNVMCYLDAIYIYLRARSDGVLGRARPVKTEGEPANWSQQEDACMS